MALVAAIRIFETPNNQVGLFFVDLFSQALLGLQLLFVFLAGLLLGTTHEIGGVPQLILGEDSNKQGVLCVEVLFACLFTTQNADL